MIANGDIQNSVNKFEDGELCLLLNQYAWEGFTIQVYDIISIEIYYACSKLVRKTCTVELIKVSLIII